ncbi:hypothetical protein FRC08_018780 [Ceratobasidium sp. 394]|nr:hypothetical protein FRC08_018780 [Ceratobasidium sp. 394]
MVPNTAKDPSYSENQPNWGIPIDIYLEKFPDHGVKKYPVDQVVSAIQTLVAGEPNILDDVTLESILSVVYYPEYLALLNTNITSTWFAMMEPYTEAHTLFEKSFGILMIQVYGLVTIVGFLDRNQNMLARFIHRVSGTGADLHKDGALSLLSLITSGMADPNVWASGRTFAQHVECFTDIPRLDQELGPSDIIFLPNIGGFDLKAALFFLKHIFDSRDRFLDAFNRVPHFGVFPILCMIRLQIWFLLQTDEGKQDALEMLTELQDIIYRCYLASDRDYHVLLKSLTSAVLHDMSNSYADYMHPVDSADAATISSTLMRHVSPTSPDAEPAQLPYLWDMFEWAQGTILEAGEVSWYPSVITALLNRIWTGLSYSPTSTKSGLRNQIMSFSGNLFTHLANNFSFQKAINPIDMISILFKVDFINLIGRLIAYSAVNLDTEQKPVNVSELSCGIDIMTSGLSERSPLLKSKSRIYYPDWVKTLEHIQHLRAGLSTLDQRNLEEFQDQWAALGKALGYDHDGQPHLSSTCSYARCTGIGAARCKSAICAGCLKAVYCSKQCQQRDWLVGLIPHSQVCRGRQGVVGANAQV